VVWVFEFLFEYLLKLYWVTQLYPYIFYTRLTISIGNPLFFYYPLFEKHLGSPEFVWINTPKSSLFVSLNKFVSFFIIFY